MTCRYDPDTSTYLNAGQPCTHDTYGDATNHCTRARCGFHIGARDRTCERCITKTRKRIHQVVELAALVAIEAIEQGNVDSEPVNLAAHATDPEAWEHRQASAHAGRVTAPPADPHAKRHPEYLLRWWAMTLRDAYGHDEPDVPETLTDAAAYLDATLNRFAHDPVLTDDPDHSCDTMHRELGAAINHAATVLRDTNRQQRGAPCPHCTAEATPPQRLVFTYGNTEPEDHWRCPTNPTHWITATDYTEWLATRKANDVAANNIA